MFCFKLSIFLLTILSPPFAFSQTKNKTPHTCPSGEHWRRPHHQSPYTRTNGTPVRGSNHPAECVKNQVSYQEWNPKLKDAKPKDWPYSKEKPKAWTEDEKEEVFEALSILPPALLLASVNGIHRFSAYVDQPSNPAISTEHEIALYDEAFKSKHKLAQILAHEFAHHLWRKFNQEERKNYFKAADWVPADLKSGKLTLIFKRKKSVELDGINRPDEDFSNNLEYFLFEPRILNETSPKVFDWINQNYGAKIRLRGER